MPDNKEAPVSAEVTVKKPSAGGLLGSLRETFGLGKKKPAEAPAAVEMPAVPSPAPVLESAPTTMLPEAAATEVPPAQEQAPSLEPTAVAPIGELPDWLSAPSVAEPIPAPEPAAPPVMEAPVVEEPVAPSVELPAPTGTAAEAEKSPEQLAIEQFEEALLAADNALGWLRVGETLDNNQLRAAKAAAATANGLIRNLPERYLKVLLASRRLGENRDYNRLDFQKDMMAAIRVFSQANKG